MTVPGIRTDKVKPIAMPLPAEQKAWMQAKRAPRAAAE
jgi:hypothetical protein